MYVSATQDQQTELERIKRQIRDERLSADELMRLNTMFVASGIPNAKIRYMIHVIEQLQERME